jgi:type III secretion protein C
VTPVTAGTTLNVTPRSLAEDNDQMVQLTIDIEDGQIQSTLLNGLPRVTRSSVSTQAIVRSNDTLLIAGHTQDQTVDNSQKVPGLGDIPVFGALFSSKSLSVQRRERLFMIKPRIISFPLGTTIGTAPIISAPNDVEGAAR